LGADVLYFAFRKLLLPIVMIGLFASLAFSQHISTIDRERSQVMLQNVASDVRKYYYDPKLHGVDWDKNVNQAREKIATANSFEEAILQIAAVLEVLDDSHTNFFPPNDPIAQEYGWRYQMVGERCFVTEVEPKSDAEGKGISRGDEVLTIEGFTPRRGDLDKIEHVLNALIPQSTLKVDVRTPAGKISHVVVRARVRQQAVPDFGDMTGRDSWRVRLEREDELRLVRPRFKELGNGVWVLKLPVFFLTDAAAEDMISRVRKYNTLILDLRSNPGGAETTLQNLLGGMFDKDVKIADRVMRDSKKTLVAKGNRKPFSGKLIVLMDSRSASAAELFARVVQIEKRAVVLGDRSSGSVMESRYYAHETGINPTFRYGTSIAEADLLMTDGKSLEHSGVRPDETILPSASDLFVNRDPVLSRAAEMAGIALTPEQAASLFPYEWPKR
jgi:C-terminal processing protease CtpA/Prc